MGKTIGLPTPSTPDKESRYKDAGIPYLECGKMPSNRSCSIPFCWTGGNARM